MPSPSTELLKEKEAWLRQWCTGANELRKQKAATLRALTDGQVRAASESLLALAPTSYRAPARETTSGLVEQQRLFHGRHQTGPISLADETGMSQ